MRILFILLLSIALTSCADAPDNSTSLANGGLYSGTLSEDASFALIGAVHEGGSLWDTRKNARLFNWNFQGQDFTVYTAVALGPDNRYAATAQGQQLAIWNVRTGQSVNFVQLPGQVRAAKFSGNGTTLALALDDGSALALDVLTGRTLGRFIHNGAVTQIAIATDGKLILSGGEDQKATLWKVDSLEIVQQIQHDNMIAALDLSDDGKLALSVAFREDTKIWLTANGSIARTLATKKSTLSVAHFIDGGRRIISGSRTFLVQEWDVSTTKELRKWRLPKKGLYSKTSTTVLDIRKIGNTILSLGSDGRLSELK